MSISAKIGARYNEIRSETDLMEITDPIAAKHISLRQI